MSWGSPNKDEKFYKGAKNDTAWNKDLLWRYHVAKETKQSKINTGEIPCPDPTLKMRHIRMKMGITGTLIPDVTPRYDDVSTLEQPRALQSSTSRRRLGVDQPEGDDTRSIVSKARSVRSPASLNSSSSASVLSSSSSSRSLRIEDIKQIVDNQSKLLKENTQDEIAAMRHALLEEARKREAAEKKLSMLCEKLGLEEK